MGGIGLVQDEPVAAPSRTDGAPASADAAPQSVPPLSPRRAAAGLLRADARPAPGRPGPDDRRHRAAQGGRRAARPGQDVLGDHLLPAHLHRAAARLRQARRPDRPQGRLPVLHPRLHRRLPAGRTGADDGPDDRLPGRAGHRRGRADDRRPGDHRGHRAAPGAGPLHGADRRRLRPRLRRRSPARRLLHRPPVLALVLLHQRALRTGHPRRRRSGAETAPVRARGASTSWAPRCWPPPPPAWCC